MAAQPKFTPGPWKLIPPGEPTPGPMYRELIALVANSPSLYVVLDDGHPLDRVPPGEWEANARLISAAPDLYAAARDINTLLRDVAINVECATTDLANEFYAAEARLRAAIAKADGDA